MSIEKEIRLGLRAQLVAGGIPPQHVDEVTDLAVHAAFNAQRAMLDVLRRSSSTQIWLTALGPAIGIAVNLLGTMEETLKRHAAEGGMRTSTVDFTVGGPQ